MMAKTFCDRWTDRTTGGTEIVDMHEYSGGFYGVGIGRCGPIILSWFNNGAAGNHLLGDLVPIPPAPVVRPWANRAEMFAVCKATPWFKRKDWVSDASPQSFRLSTTGLWIDGTSWTWKELASLWLWYPDYGSDDGKPCVIEVKP